MKKIIAAFAVAAACGFSAAHAQDAAKPAPKVKKPECPIMKHEVAKMDAKMKSEYKGKTYYFCCAGCKPSFDKMPEAEKAKLAKYGVPNKKPVAPKAKKG